MDDNRKGSGADTKLGSLAYRPVVRVSASATIAEAARELQAQQISSVLVGDSPRRLVTERDVVRSVAQGLEPGSPVAEIASTVPLWITTTSTVKEAATVMKNHEVRHLIVIDGITGRSVGVVSLRDVLEVLISSG